MAKQYRPRDQYDAQLNDPQVEQSQDNREALLNSGLPVNSPVNPWDPINPAYNLENQVYQSNPRGYLIDKYNQAISAGIKDVETRGLLNTSQVRMQTDELTYDPHDLFSVDKSMLKKNWYSLTTAIKEIKEDRWNGENLQNEMEIDKIKNNHEDYINMSDSEKEAEVNEILADIEKNNKKIEENNLKLEKQKEYLGKYFLDKLEKDKSNTRFWPDSFAEAMDHFGGAMSDIEMLATTVVLPWLGKVGGGIAGGFVTGGLTTSPSGPWALLGAGVGALAGGIGAMFINKEIRKHESSAETWEAYTSKIDGLKREYRAQNAGQDPSPDKIKEFEQRAKLGIKNVFDQNMNLWYSDIAQMALVWVPWTKPLKGLIPIKNTSKALKKVGRLGRFGVYTGAQTYWEAREEGDQMLIKNNYLRGDYDDQDLQGLKSIIASLGTAWETTEGMGRNVFDGLYDGRVTGGRTGSKEFRDAVNAGAFLGLVMGGGTSTIQESAVKGYEKYNQLRYGQDIGDIDKAYENIANAEQTRSRALWLWKKLEDGTFDRIEKSASKIKKFFPDLEIDQDQVTKEMKEARLLHKMLNGKEYTKYAPEQKRNLFQAILSQRSNFTTQGKNSFKATEKFNKELDEINTDGQKEGTIEAIAFKARIKAMNELLNEHSKKIDPNKDKNPRYSKFINNAAITKLKESINAHQEKYNKHLKDYNLKDSEISDERMQLLINHAKDEAATSISSLISRDAELRLKNPKRAGDAFNDPFVDELTKNEKKAWEDFQKQRKEKKEVEETLPDQDQKFETGDQVWFMGKKGIYTNKRTKDGVKHFFTADGQTHELTTDELNTIQKRTKISKIKAALKNTKNKIKNKTNKVKEKFNSLLNPIKNPPHKDKNPDDHSSDIEKQDKINKEENETTNKVDKEKQVTPEGNKDLQNKDRPKTKKVSDDIPNGDNTNQPSFAIPRGSALHLYIHGSSLKDLRGKKVKYTIDWTESERKIKSYKKVWKKLANKEPLTKEEYDKVIGQLVVKVEVLDSKGQPIPGLETNLFDAHKNYIKEGINIKHLKKQIYEAHTLGKNAYGVIIDGIAGNFNDFPGESFPIQSLFKDENSIILAYSNGNEYTDANNTTWGHAPDSSNAHLFAMFYDEIEKIRVPVKLNNRRLTRGEALEIFDIVMKLISSTKQNPITMKTIYINKDGINTGLTIEKYLRLLTNMKSGKETTKEYINTILEWDPKAESFRYGDNILNIGNIKQAKENFISHIIQHKFRAVHSYGLNTNIFNAKMFREEGIENFTFLGKRFKKGVNDNYNKDFVAFFETVNTNTKVINGHVQGNENLEGFTSRKVFLSNNIFTNKNKSKKGIKKKTDKTDKQAELDGENNQEGDIKTKEENTGTSGDNSEDAFSDFMEATDKTEKDKKDNGPIDIDKAEAWLKKVLGSKVPVVIQRSLIAMAKKGAFAYGMFHRGMITLSKKAVKGAEYHEAYHAVEELYLDSDTMKDLNAESRQKYGAPTQDDLQTIKDKYPNENLTDLEAERIHFSEIRAEDFRVWQLAGDNLSFGQKTLRWFKMIQAWLKHVFNGKKGMTTDLLFHRISSGYYGKRNPLPWKVKLHREGRGRLALAMEVEGLTRETFENTTGTFIRMLIDRVNGGFLSIKNIQEFKIDKNYLSKTLTKVISEEEVKGNEGRARRLELIRDVYLDLIIENISIVLSQMNIREREEQQRSNDDLKSATKSHFETGGKDNATTNTKLILSFLPKFENGKLVLDSYTGFPVMENPTYIWNTVEAAMADIVDIKDDTGSWMTSSKQMMNALRTLGQSNTTFERLVKVLEDLNENERIQFFTSMSKSNNNFLSVNYGTKETIFEGVVNTILGYKYYNPEQQGKARRLVGQWLEKYKVSKLFNITYNENQEAVISPNKPLIAKIYNNWKKYKTDYKRPLQKYYRENQTVPLEMRLKLIEFLTPFGIEVDLKAVDYLIDKLGKGNTLIGYNKLFNNISYLYKSKGKGSTKRFSLLNIHNNKVDIDFVDNNTIRGEGSVIYALANAQSLFTQDSGQTTILGPENKTYWIYSLNNYLKKKTLQLNASKTHIEDLAKIPFNKDSRWLYWLTAKQKDKKFKIRVFNTLKKEGGRDMGTSYDQLSPGDEHALRINLLLNNFYSPATMADKGVWYLFEGPETMPLSGFDYSLDSDTYNIPDPVIDRFIKYSLTELERIKSVEDSLFGPNALPDNKLIEYYHYKKTNKGISRKQANGLKSIIFPSFNDLDFLKEIGVMTKDGIRLIHWPEDIFENKTFRSKISEIINQRIKEEINTAIDNGVIIKRDNNTLVNNSIESKLIIPFVNDFSNQRLEADITRDKGIRKAIATYGINSIIANIETMKLYTGDPAFYKSLDDLSKRMPELIAPGQDLSIISGHEQFKVAIIRDLEKKSDYYDQYFNAYKNLTKLTDTEIKQILSPYENVNITDAQAYITLDRFKSIMRMLGRWDTDWNSAFKRLKAGKGTQEDIKLITAMPLKGMHYQLRNHLGLAVPTYLKYSQAVLIPQLIKGTELEKLHKTMLDEKTGVDEVIFESGIKVGAQSPIGITQDDLSTIKDDIKFNIMVLDNTYWKLQQDLRPHTKDEQLEGSQIKKNIIANIELDKTYMVDGETILGRDLVKKVHAIDRELSDLGKRELFNEFGIETLGEGVYVIKNWDKLHDILVKEFLKKKDSSKKLIKSLELNSDKTNFERPLDTHPFRKQIDQMIGSLITRRTVKLEMPGGSFVQMSNFGFNRVGRYSNLTAQEQAELDLLVNESKLRPATIDKNKVVRAQIFLPHWFKDLIPGFDKMSRKQINNYIQDKKLLRAIGYRIPNQGMSSIDSLEVVGFLPQSVGDTVIAYDDITAKTGSDFDIDKMYIMLSNHAKDKETGKPYYIKYKEEGYSNPFMQKKALQNRKLELYDAILTNSKTYVDLITPLDSISTKFRAAKVRFLENKNKLNPSLVSKIESLDSSKTMNKFIDTVNDALSSKIDLEWFSPAYQLQVKSTFVGGKFGVGQTARHLVDHSISQWSDTTNEENSAYYLKVDLGFGNKTTSGWADLSKSHGVAGNLISNTLSARLNAYVDIAKDPYIFYINNNTITANTIFMLDRAGIDPQWTDLFMSQPILKEFVKLSRYNEAGSTKKLRDENKKLLTPEQQLIIRYKTSIIDILKEQGKKELDLDSIKIGDLTISKYRNKLAEEEGAQVDDILTLQKLQDMIDITKDKDLKYLYDQLRILKLFLTYKQSASTLNNAVTASKSDTEGASGGIVNSIVAENLKELVLQQNVIGGFLERFNQTMLGKYFENGPILMQDLFKGQFNINSIAFKSAVDRIASTLR